MYQLFLNNKHIEHPELNEEREVYNQEVAGAEGAKGTSHLLLNMKI